MRHPEFKMWPWGLMSIVAAFLPIAAAKLFAEQPQAKQELLAPVMLSLLAAGNAYIVAIAGGNFSATMLAIPVGVAVSFVALPALSYMPLYIIYVLMLFLGASAYFIEWIFDLWTGSYGMIVMFISAAIVSAAIGLLGIGCVLVLNEEALKNPIIGMLVVFPLVMSAVTAMLVVRTGRNGPVEGFFAGFEASVWGILCLLASAPFVLIFEKYTRSDKAAAVVAGLAYLWANYICLKTLFPKLDRVMARSVPILPTAASVTDAAAAAAAAATPLAAEPATVSAPDDSSGNK